ncbi:MAG TPA: ABC transporter substrate-binding protein [Candidatus Limnocylindria bacterium]|nr:ABC transporter substrate-binding protein [Candidatus Limnocylindria bacterium]
MRTRTLSLLMALGLILAACTGGGGGDDAGGDGAGASPGATGAAGGDGATECIGEGDVILSGWQASEDEGELLEQMFAGFEEQCPNITIDYQPVAGDYAQAMIANFSAGTPPDVFYVDSSVAPEWIEEGFLLPLDDYIAESGVDTAQFYPGYLDAFRGPDDQIYGLPKDASTLAMFYNTDMLEEAGVEPPTNWEELQAAAEALTTGDVTGLCLSPSLDRALAFIYQNGGSIYNEDLTEVTFDSPETREALEYYLGLFESGFAATPATLGSGWCGEAIGQGKVAIVFEGNWLIPSLENDFPDINYAHAEMPAGAEQATLAFTVSYSIGADSANADAAWSLLSYLTGPEGMETWTSLGLALPSRQDVPAPEGREALLAGAEYARPWSFVPGFADVTTAFNNTFTAATEGSGSVDEIVSATTEAAQATVE